MSERFMKYVNKTPTCWLWTGSSNRKGYGWFRLGKVMNSHRAAWLLFKGQISAGQFVCHSCDVPACVNPDHLFLGTNRDNVRDAVLKGRTRKRTSRAMSEEAAMLRIAGWSYKRIAEHLRVSTMTAWALLNSPPKYLREPER